MREVLSFAPSFGLNAALRKRCGRCAFDMEAYTTHAGDAVEQRERGRRRIR
jgi:hypothetical protein